MQSMTDAELQARIRNTDRPLLVDFWATWCRPCRLMERSLEAIEADFAPRLDIVKVDVEAAATLARELDIHAVPTLVLYKEGRSVDTMSGVLPPSELRQWIQRNL